MAKGICSIEGCDEKHRARGFCATHYWRWSRYGSPELPTRTLAERFWAKVDVRGLDECWPWLGKLSEQGYGIVGREQARAHRVAYAIATNLPLPPVLHHRCENKCCVNPAHLEPTTATAHCVLHAPSAAYRAAMAARPTCRRGHSKAAYGYHNGRQWICRACKRQRKRQRKHAAS